MPAIRRYDMERQTALLAEEAGEAVNAMIRWALAAQATSDKLEQVEALANARRCSELAFHQAIWAAVWGRPKRHPWREIAPLTGIAWQTLYRRYRQTPKRLPRASVSVDEHGNLS